MNQRIRLCTIGHSNRSLEDFLGLLQKHDVRLMIDIRSRPFSRFEQFNQNILIPTLSHLGIDYEYMGNLLGGKPPSENVVWKQGKLNPTLVSELRETDTWVRGLKLLKDKIQKKTAEGVISCLLCSERRADQCHRNAVAFDLSQMLDLEIQHIDSGGAEVGVQEKLI